MSDGLKKKTFTVSSDMAHYYEAHKSYLLYEGQRTGNPERLEKIEINGNEITFFLKPLAPIYQMYQFHSILRYNEKSPIKYDVVKIEHKPYVDGAYYIETWENIDDVPYDFYYQRYQMKKPKKQN